MKKIVLTDKAPMPIGPFSQGIVSNGFLFISGQLPIVPEGKTIVMGNISVQTERVLENIVAILEASGYALKNVVKTTCLLRNLDDFNAMNEVYARYFNDDPPCRVTYQVAKLPLDALIEIDAIAVG
ncbi:MAG: RidA family protein [Bacteroidales bacterium]|jgi:2-iminobutanoate/2-iminopropanoate deaminase|nr:RidA family protein [Bacteroidales bacterium]